MIKPNKVADRMFKRLEGATDAQAKKLAVWFAEYAVKRNAGYLIPTVARRLRERLEAKRAAETLRIAAPFEVSTRLKHDLRERIGAPKDAPIEAVLDEGLIGGVRVEYGGRVIDATMRTRLAKLKDELLLEQ